MRSTARNSTSRNPNAIWIAIALISLFSLLAACDQVVITAEEIIALPGMQYPYEEGFLLKAIAPIPKSIALDADKIRLGERLFHDKRLSGNDTISCASCHNLQAAGVDNLAQSIGIHGARTILNTPTVYNSGFNFTQFWNGRATNLVDQIEGPIHGKSEMGASWKEIISKLLDDQYYLEAFRRIYNTTVTVGNIKDAIAVFEQSLITPDSRYDRYLRGEKSVLSEQEQYGHVLFNSLGCVSCHQGMNIGGNLYEKIGVMEEYYTAKVSFISTDYGRYNLTGEEDDKFVFKVPSLRNVALTAPYLHNGTIPTLEAVVSLMIRYQLGRRVNENEVEAIVAFLKTLTGPQFQ